MSRIHDALKKAAEERNAQALNRSVSDLVELTNEGLTFGVSSAVEQRESQQSVAERQPSVAERQASVAERPDTLPLKYEEFVKGCSRPVWKTEPYSSVFALQANDPVGAEKFRTLRSRLYQIAAAQPVKRLLVTSSMPAEGKTFVVASLAQSIVRQTNRRVLLIDADLRASRLHLLLGAPDRPGLTDYLRGDANEFQITQVGPSGNLCLIPGGQEVSNPSELLHSDPMKRLLDRVSNVFDWVILDSPPALAVHDASIIADMCDGVIFVIRSGSTAFECVEKASAEFRKKNLLGVVLNGVQRGDTYDDYYYGYNSEKASEAKP